MTDFMDKFIAEPHSINILILEDNPGDLRLLKEALKSEKIKHFTIIHSETLTEGISTLNDSNIDVVLLDLSLPDSQGFDTFRKIHEAFSQLPIVVLTGFDDEDLAIRAVKEGAQDYLVKGKIDGKVLVRSIRYAFERMRAEEAMRKTYVLKNVQQLAAAICHEFSQPLQTLSGCIALAENPENKEYIDICRKMVFRITELLNNLRQITDLKKQKYLTSQIFDIKASSALKEKKDGFKILVVDDDSDVLNTLLQGLKHEGYECDGATDGLQTLNLMNTNMYELILSDLNMPRIPGTTFFSMFKAINYPAYFIFLTGYSVPGELEDIVKRADGVITKPVNFTDLFSYIRNLLKKDQPGTNNKNNDQFKISSHQV
ncbi:MAG: response regulator [Calditrichia bacterium]